MLVTASITMMMCSQQFVHQMPDAFEHLRAGSASIRNRTESQSQQQHRYRGYPNEKWRLRRRYAYTEAYNPPGEKQWHDGDRHAVKGHAPATGAA